MAACEARIPNASGNSTRCILPSLGRFEVVWWKDAIGRTAVLTARLCKTHREGTPLPVGIQGGGR